MRGIPGEHEGDARAFRDYEFRHGGETFPVGIHRGMEIEGIRAGRRTEHVPDLAHPGDNRPVVEADHQLHAHAHLAAHAFDDPDDVGARVTRRHEVDETDYSALGFELRLEDQGLGKVTTARR